jgi:putative transferase (TIGR04331 family)
VDINPDCHDYNHFLISSALFSIGVSKDKAIKVQFESKNNKDEKISKVKTKSTLIVKIRKLFLCIKKIIINMTNKSGIIRLNRLVIVNSYLPRFYEFLLNILCFNFPIPNKASRISAIQENIDLRRGINCGVNSKDPFLNFSSSLLPKLIPKYLLEGFEEISLLSRNNGWPRISRCIFTSNSFQFDEVFQYYVAMQKKLNGSKFIIGQHGGVSGILKWSFGETHQIRIADKFISWGWNPGLQNVVPGFVLTNVGQKIKHDPKGGVLLTTVPMRLYSHKGGSWPVGPKQSKEFLEDQITFYSQLDDCLANKTVLRIHESLDLKFNSGYLDEWKSKFPEIRIDKSTESIKRVLKKTRLFVYTYNSTGYLETLSMNFPTVMFWNVDLFETKKEFSEALTELEKVGIFHKDPTMAAEHINSKWSDLEGWWNSIEVQAVRKSFVQSYAQSRNMEGILALKNILIN